ncbi:MAG: ABC transporter substrate-binding protein [Actinobacteria bacterium]|nr:MAG: ABC transporter substrate-binding protein [Actinomycetota bacterium]
MRLSRAFTAAAAATALLVAAGCTSGSGAANKNNPAPIEKVTYATGFGQFGRDAYVYVGIDKGYFRDAGIDVTVKPGTGTGDNLKQLTAGNIDFAPVDFTGAMILIGGGQVQGVTAVAAIHQRTLACIMTLDGRNISSPKDLEGHTVGDPTGSTIGLMFPTYAKLAGIDASRVKFVNIAAQQLPQTLASGTVDTIGQFVVGVPTIEKAAGGKKAVVLPYSDFINDVYGNVLVTSTKLAQQKPDLVKKFTAALMKSLQYAVNNPEEAGKILHSHVPTQDATVAAGELKLMKQYVNSSSSGAAIGALDQQRIARSIALMQGANAIPAGLTPDRLVDFGLTPKG